MMPLKTIRMLFFPFLKVLHINFILFYYILNIYQVTSVILTYCWFLCVMIWRRLKILSIKSSIHILSYSSSSFGIQCDLTMRNPVLWNSINYSINVSGLFYVNSLIYVICHIIVLFFCRERPYIIYWLRPEVNFYIILAV
jgi:hypothetical protein